MPQRARELSSALTGAETAKAGLEEECSALSALLAATTGKFAEAQAELEQRRCAAPLLQEVASPFSEGGAATPSATGPLALTLDNVELTLDEMRPYLMADGGNVAVRSIEGGVVELELQGACGSCPSSTMTMKMGLERGLREKIPEIIEVIQVAPDGPQLTEEGIEEVLEEIRPFLKMAGGDCDLVSLEVGLVPTAKLSISGSGATINSVRVEIAQRLKRNFPTLANVVWD